MPKFNLYYGVEREQFNLHTKQRVELPSLNDAKQEAQAHAEDLYMQNPKNDILELMKNKRVNELIAESHFNLEMSESIVFHIEEIIEIGGQVIEVIRHDYKE